MSTEASAAGGLVLDQNGAAPDNVRRSANFHPSIWGDHFLAYASHHNLSVDVGVEKQIEQLKEQVRRNFVGANTTSLKLVLVDSIQRLGLAYHFENQIEQALEHIYGTPLEGDLYHVALRFRLLRQQGYNVSCDMFNKFRDDQNKFKQNLTSDVQGLLSLYEATHIRVDGEDILDEALPFTITHLDSIKLNSPLATQVSNALNQPIHMGIPRLEARKYITVYQQQMSCDQTLLTLAKLDFNQLQKIHQNELCEISRWWKDLDFATKLPFARDRVVECYFWILGVYFEPQYYLARRILTKVIAMTSIIDDIYDVYGTIDELQLFTKAVNRWDISNIGQLPQYMQICYQALFDVYNEIEEAMNQQGTSYRLYYAKEAMKNQVNAYFMEAKWCSKQYVPTMEEYMQVALVTSAYTMLATTSFVGMGEVATKETFEWISKEPRIAKASAIICRLMDDMVSHKFEQERGHVASGIECYMKQHGVSEEEVRTEFRKQVTIAWKVINQECFQSTVISKAVLIRVLNLARVIDVVYKDDDGYTNAGITLKSYVSSLLIDHIAI
uniref:Terpenoid synthase n=1 Tax=Paeonia lactiflora TaxID=35924 RepID=A0A160DR27_PAELC|nr:terpenoid synthase [Paeonia lactiflora]